MPSPSRRRLRRGSAPEKPLETRIIECRRCARLVQHREHAAAHPPRRFQGERYWARPLVGFGDRQARVVIVGLAPAAHGGNRTGRFFTGDSSGDWLFRALYEAGFANQPVSVHAGDGLVLTDAFVTAAVRCAPPDNKPLPEETRACAGFLHEELLGLERATVTVALGGFAWKACLGARLALDKPLPRPRPAFGHGALVRFDDATLLLGSYHPSQQNTFTGRLTRTMLREIFERARALLPGPDHSTRTMKHLR